MKIWLLTASAMLAALAAPAQAQENGAALFSAFADPRIDAPLVDLRVSEEVTAPADIARFTVMVATDDDSSEAALRANSAKTTAVLAALRAQGLTDADFKPGQLSIDQRRGGRNSSVRGYTARNRISVETGDVGRVALMIAAAVAAGSTHADGPYYDKKDMEPLLAPARERLFRQAERQAKNYARAGGYTRVRPVALSERIDGGQHVAAMAAFGVMSIGDAGVEEMAPPTPSTDVTRSIVLSISFRIER